MASVLSRGDLFSFGIRFAMYPLVPYQVQSSANLIKRYAYGDRRRAGENGTEARDSDQASRPLHPTRGLDDPRDGRALGIPLRHRDRRDLGDARAILPLFRDLAARDQYRHDDRDVPDGLLDPE